MAEHGPSEGAIKAAAGAYVFGVYPGDESEASEEEVEKMARERTVAAVVEALADEFLSSPLVPRNARGYRQASAEFVRGFEERFKLSAPGGDDGAQ